MHTGIAGTEGDIFYALYRRIPINCIKISSCHKTREFRFLLRKERSLPRICRVTTHECFWGITFNRYWRPTLMSVNGLQWELLTSMGTENWFRAFVYSESKSQGLKGPLPKKELANKIKKISEAYKKSAQSKWNRVLKSKCF